MLFQQTEKVSLSAFYDVLSNLSPSNTQRIKDAWEKELSVTIDEETWENIWNCAKKIFICTRTKAIQFKIIHKINMSPSRRHVLNPSHSPLCLKCKTEKGISFHCMWSCHKLQKYWSKVLHEMERIFGKDFGMNPVSLILGLPCKNLTTVASKRLHNIFTFAARKNILLKWTSGGSRDDG